jgi:hypothetical protein
MLCAQRSAPVIFIGRVTKAVNDERVRVTVLEGFKGVGDGSVVELPSGNGSMCGYDFEVGEPYLIFASPTESGALGTGLCSGNRRLSEVSTAVLNDLQDLRRGYGRSEIVGALVQSRAGDGSFAPLSNIRVTASRGGKSFHAMTNKQGRFRIGLDGPGDFSISPDLPAALTLADANLAHATVAAHACAWVDLTAVNNARISGRLIAPAGVDVEAIPINVTSTNGRGRELGAQTGADGRYEIAGIDPGEYVLGINIPCIPSTGLPFEKTLYPGVHNDADATRFRIDGPVSLEGKDLPFSGPVARASVSVTVTTRDGHPVKGAYIQRSKACGMDYPTPTDETGRATVELFRGDRWTLAATMRDETNGMVMCSTVERAGPEGFPASIQLVVDQPSCRLMRNSFQIDRMKSTEPGESRIVPIRVLRTDGRAMFLATLDVTSAKRLSLMQLETGEDGRIDVPLPVGRIVLLAARDGSCSSVPIVVDTSEATVRWRRLGPDENLSTWRAAGPFDRSDALELVFERVAPWCR